MFGKLFRRKGGKDTNAKDNIKNKEKDVWKSKDVQEEDNLALNNYYKKDEEYKKFEKEFFLSSEEVKDYKKALNEEISKNPQSAKRNAGSSKTSVNKNPWEREDTNENRA